MSTADAHAWVEAWFPGPGWTTFDPTPLTDGRTIVPPYVARAARGDRRPTGDGTDARADPAARSRGDDGGGGRCAGGRRPPDPPAARPARLPGRMSRSGSAPSWRCGGRVGRGGGGAGRVAGPAAQAAAGRGRRRRRRSGRRGLGRTARRVGRPRCAGDRERHRPDRGRADGARSRSRRSGPAGAGRGGRDRRGELVRRCRPGSGSAVRPGPAGLRHAAHRARRPCTAGSSRPRSPDGAGRGRGTTTPAAVGPALRHADRPTGPPRRRKITKGRRAPNGEECVTPARSGGGTAPPCAR